jgi:putative MATE family efflux protein
MKEDFQKELHILVRLSLPLMASQAGMMFLGVVETLLMGRAGNAALAAVSLGNVWTHGTMMVAMGVVMGADPILSQAYGAGDSKTVALTFQRGLVLSILLSLPISLLWLYTRPVLGIFGQDAHLSALAGVFVAVQAPTAFGFLVFTITRQYLAGRGVVAPSLWVVVIVNVLNAGLTWWLVFGGGGLPAVLGAGLAGTTVRLLLPGLLLVVTFWAGLHRPAWIPWSKEAFNWRRIARIAWIGLPVGLHFGLEVWAFQISTLMAGKLGQVPLGAHAIVFNLASLSFMFPLGISTAASVRVGNLIGAGDEIGARQAARLSLLLGADTLNLKWITSPSRTTYSLPSMASLAFWRQAASERKADQIFPPDHVGLDEAALEVGVDGARRLRSLGAARDGPRPALVLARGEEGDEVQDRVGGARHAVQAGLFESQALQKGRTIRSVEPGDLGLGGRANGDQLGAFLGRVGAQGRHGGVAVEGGQLLLGHVGHVEDLLVGEQKQLAQKLVFLVGKTLRAHRHALGQALLDLHTGLKARLLVLGRAALHGGLGAIDALLDGFQILEAQLGVDGQDVRHRIDAAIDVDDVVVLEAAHHVRDGVGLADVGEKLVAQPFALGSPTHQAGDIDEIDRGRHDRFRMVELDQGVEAWIRHLHHADVRLDGAERIVGDGRSGRRQRIKKRRLAHVGQADDSA